MKETTDNPKPFEKKREGESVFDYLFRFLRADSEALLLGLAQDPDHRAWLQEQGLLPQSYRGTTDDISESSGPVASEQASDPPSGSDPSKPTPEPSFGSCSQELVAQDAFSSLVNLSAEKITVNVNLILEGKGGSK